MRGHIGTTRDPLGRVSSLHWNSHTLARLVHTPFYKDVHLFMFVTVAVEVEQFISMMFVSKTTVWELDYDTDWKCVD